MTPGVRWFVSLVWGITGSCPRVLYYLPPAMSGLASHYCYSEPGSQGGGSQEQGGGEEPQGRVGEAEQDEDCS